MRYHALVVDYDGTIALHGQVPQEVVQMLEQVKASSRKLVLVTGRELDELKEIFPSYAIFDKIVAENGALLYNPATLEEKKLGDPPPPFFVDELVTRGVHPVSVGRVIVATWEPHQHTVLEVIKNAGVERQVIFNKGAVMILPPGINKAKGLEAALEELGLSMHNIVAAGDAENDSAMLLVAECSVAVANALQAVKDGADWVTPADHGAGVIQLAQRLLDNDLADLDHRLTRHYLKLGKQDNTDFLVSSYRNGILLAGASGGGKTTFTAAFLENLQEKKYQFCLLDPEGDYADLKDCVVIGDNDHPPLKNEILTLLKTTVSNVVVCLLAVSFKDRPSYVRDLLSEVFKLQASLGHPHWLILDEVHHLFPVDMEPSSFNIPADFNNFMMITTSPSLVNQEMLSHTGMLITVGHEPQQVIDQFAERRGIATPSFPIHTLPKGEAWIWDVTEGKDPFVIKAGEPSQLLKRHKKKYAAGDMESKSFYFTGPASKLNLKAQNLILFMQLAEGVDDDTWMFHLKRKDYSTWVREAIGDDELADLIEQTEANDDTIMSSKNIILKYINERYTLPA